VHVIVGGVIPTRDIQRLKDMGISGVYPGGTPFQEIIDGIHDIVD